MSIRMPRWTQADTPLSGEAYAAIGLTAFIVKFLCDKAFAHLVFSRSWHMMNYIQGANAFYLWDLRKQDVYFFASMLAIAIPFLAFGVAMTLRRLNTLKFSPWLVILFFIPLLNLSFFIALSSINQWHPPTPLLRPPHPTDQGIGRFIPHNTLANALLAITLTATMGTLLVGFNAAFLKRYGWGLFVLLPFTHGLLIAWLHSFHQPRTLSDCQLLSALSCLLLGVCLLVFAIEGAICIAMASPIWLCISGVGAWVGWGIQQARWDSIQKTFAVLVCIFALPFLTGAEYAMHPPAPIFPARTTIDIQAPPQVVWNHVVTFSELPPPTEWVFKTGLSYPVRARIHGHGVGAMRHCEFSTGIFVEPIEVWNEPALLKFSVINTPSPMEEMSLYSHIEPPHLHGYLISRAGQFLLTPLPNGGTRLEGTTWYQHNLWPASYWQLWTNYIIHQIHGRVLRHIKNLAEQDMGIQNG